MTFSYEIQSSPTYHSEETDEDFYETEEITYEADYDEVENAIVDIIAKGYFKNVVIDKQTFKKQLKDFLSDLDINDQLEEVFEDDLKEYFREEALESRS